MKTTSTLSHFTVLAGACAAVLGLVACGGGGGDAVGNRGGVTLTNNRIDGNLQCKENNPAPTGGGNTASSKEDQCASL